MGRAQKPSWHGCRQVQDSTRQRLLEETSLCMQHMEALQQWHSQLASVLKHVLGQCQVQVSVGPTLASIHQWARQQRQRQLEGLAALWKLLYGDAEGPTQVVLESSESQVLEAVRQLVRQLLDTVAEVPRVAKRPQPPAEPPPEHLLRRRGTPEDSVSKPPYPTLSSLDQRSFESQQQEFESQKRQLQQELASLLQQRAPEGRRTSGLQLLQELEQLSAQGHHNHVRFRELEERLRQELQVSQQSQVEQQVLQQLELEMELQKQEALKQSEPSGEGSEHRDSFGELRLALQETLQQLEQINAWQPSIDEEQRQTLWMYLQAELANVKPDPICPKDWNWKGKGRPFKGKTTFVTGEGKARDVKRLNVFQPGAAQTLKEQRPPAPAQVHQPGSGQSESAASFASQASASQDAAAESRSAAVPSAVPKVDFFKAHGSVARVLAKLRGRQQNPDLAVPKGPKGNEVASQACGPALTNSDVTSEIRLEQSGGACGDVEQVPLTGIWEGEQGTNPVDKPQGASDLPGDQTDGLLREASEPPAASLDEPRGVWKSSAWWKVHIKASSEGSEALGHTATVRTAQGSLDGQEVGISEKTGKTSPSKLPCDVGSAAETEAATGVAGGDAHGAAGTDNGNTESATNTDHVADKVAQPKDAEGTATVLAGGFAGAAASAPDGHIRTGVEVPEHLDQPDFRVAFRLGPDHVLRPKLPWSSRLPRSLLAGMDGGDAEAEAPVRPDGTVRLRVFDGDLEQQGFAIELPCIVFGSSLRHAHVADGTHSSIKTEHAALVFAAPDSYLLQPIHGEVTLTAASSHAAVSNALLRERRAAPQSKVSKLLGVGSSPEDVTRQYCCFQLGKSALVFFLDLLPSAASVRALGTSRHLLHAFIDGQTRAAEVKRRSALDSVREGRETVSTASTLSKDAPKTPPVNLPFRSLETRARSPSVWRHDKVQRSPSRAGSPKRQREPSSESLPKRPRGKSKTRKLSRSRAGRRSRKRRSEGEAEAHKARSSSVKESRKLKAKRRKTHRQEPKRRKRSRSQRRVRRRREKCARAKAKRSESKSQADGEADTEGVEDEEPQEAEDEEDEEVGEAVEQEEAEEAGEEGEKEEEEPEEAEEGEKEEEEEEGAEDDEVVEDDVEVVLSVSARQPRPPRSGAGKVMGRRRQGAVRFCVAPLVVLD